MTFTPGFEIDIFISYCHDDNDAPRGKQGWVDIFHESLESWLARRFGRKQIVIWRDKDLQGSTLFDQRIKEKNRRSALFLAFISPNYLRSDYCHKELAWFYDEAQKSRYGLSIDHEYRILPVFLRNIPHPGWPQELKGISGFPMHDQEEDSESLGESLDHRDKAYDERLRKIVDAVESILNIFAGEGEGRKETKEEGEEKRRIEEQDRLVKEQAGLQEKQAAEQRLNNLTSEIKEKEMQLEKLAGQIEEDISRFQDEQAEKEKRLMVSLNEIDKKEKHLDELERAISEKDQVLQEQAEKEKDIMARLKEIKKKDNQLAEWEQQLNERAAMLEKQAEEQDRMAEFENTNAEKRQKEEQVFTARINKLKEDEKKLADQEKQLNDKATQLDKQAEKLRCLVDEEKLREKEIKKKEQDLIDRLDIQERVGQKLAAWEQQLNERAAMLEKQAEEQNRMAEFENTNAEKRQREEQVFTARINKLKEDEKKLADQEKQLNDKATQLDKQAEKLRCLVDEEKLREKEIKKKEQDLIDRLDIQERVEQKLAAWEQQLNEKATMLEKQAKEQDRLSPDKKSDEDKRERELRERLFNENAMLLERQDVWQKKLRRLTRALTVVIALALFLASGMVYMLINPPETYKNEAGDKGKISQSKPKESENKKLSKPELRNFSPETSGGDDKSIKTVDKSQSEKKKPNLSGGKNKPNEMKPSTVGNKNQISEVKDKPAFLWPQTLADNYNIAREYDEKAMKALELGKETKNSAHSRDAWLYMTAAFRQRIDSQNLHVRPQTAGALFFPAVVNAALGGLWVEPSAFHHTALVTCMAFSPDGHTIAYGCRTIRLWDVNSNQEIVTLIGHTYAVLSVAFSPDGRTITLGSYKTIILWDIQKKKEIATLSGHNNWVSSVAFSPDGQTIASGSDDHTTRLWDVNSKKEIACLNGHNDLVRCVAFSPDGKIIASGSWDGTVRLWAVREKKEIARLEGHTDAVWSVTFSPDGQTIASGSLDHTIRLWAVRERKEIATLSGHTGWIRSVAFSPDDQIIASGSYDKTIRLWDRNTYQEISTLTGHSDVVWSVAFSPDGQTIASASDDETIGLWDLSIFNLFLKGGKPTPLFFAFAEGLEFYLGYRVEGFMIKKVGIPDKYDEKFRPLLQAPAPGQSKFDHILAWAKKQVEKSK